MELNQQLPAKRWVAILRAALGHACLLTALSCGENLDRIIVALPPDAGTSDAGLSLGAIGSPVGFAGVAGLGLETTTGGGFRTADFVASCSELKSMLEDKSRPRVVVVSQSIDCRLGTPLSVRTCERDCDASTNDANRKAYRVLPADASDCSQVSGGAASDPIVTKTHDETLINVASNKTLLGQGDNAAITGAILYIQNQSNVIVQNLALGEVNPHLLEAGDAITIDGSDHVWVDHCTFSSVSDGFVDAINTSTHVTLSWNRFLGANPDACAGQHNYSNNIEGSVVTLHHDLWNHTLGYSPKISRGSRVHLFNDYWVSVLYYSVQVASESQATIQANAFEGSKKPYYASSSCFEDSIPCGIQAPAETPNLFEGISVNETHETGGVVEPLPYAASSYPIEAAADARRSVLANAGNTLKP